MAEYWESIPSELSDRAKREHVAMALMNRMKLTNEKVCMTVDLKNNRYLFLEKDDNRRNH